MFILTNSSRSLKYRINEENQTKTKEDTTKIWPEIMWICLESIARRAEIESFRIIHIALWNMYCVIISCKWYSYLLSTTPRPPFFTMTPGWLVSYDSWIIDFLWLLDHWFPMTPGWLVGFHFPMTPELLVSYDSWIVGFLWLLDCWFPMTPGSLVSYNSCLVGFLWLLVGWFPMTPGGLVSYDSWCDVYLPSSRRELMN